METLKYLYATVFVPHNRVLICRTKLPSGLFTRWNSSLYKQCETMLSKEDMISGTERLLRSKLGMSKDQTKDISALEIPIRINKSFKRTVLSTTVILKNNIEMKLDRTIECRAINYVSVINALLKPDDNLMLTDIAMETLTLLIEKGLFKHEK